MLNELSGVLTKEFVDYIRKRAEVDASRCDNIATKIQNRGRDDIDEDHHHDYDAHWLGKTSRHE